MHNEQKYLSRIKWQPLHEVAYRQLRQAIMSGRYEPGQSLTVRATAAALGVSPMPVRAAFSRLVAERAVEASANGTVLIPMMTRDRLDDLVEMRILLEGTAAERASSRISAGDLVALEDLARSIVTAVETNDPAYLELNQRFKFTVAAASDSPTLEDLIERLWLQIGPFMHFYVKNVRALSKTHLYFEIIAGLRAHDSSRARRAIEEDIRGGARFLMREGVFVDSSEEDNRTDPRSPRKDTNVTSDRRRSRVPKS